MTWATAANAATTTTTATTTAVASFPPLSLPTAAHEVLLVQWATSYHLHSLDGCLTVSAI